MTWTWPALNRRRLGLALVVVLLAGAALWLARRAPVVDALTVQQAPLVRTLQFSARVATLSRVDVGSTLTGRIDKVLVSEGMQVNQGQPLVQLEQTELNAALALALAAEQQADARLAGLRSSGRAAARAGLSQSAANLEAVAAELVRVQALVKQGFVSASRLDEAERALGVAQAQQAGAQAQVQANSEQGTDVAQARAQAVLARAATAAARARLAQAVVRAPADAKVLARQVEPGQIVQPGRALLSLALSGPIQLVAQMDERFLSQVRVGQPASVVADAFAHQRFAATVLSIAPGVDPQRGAIEVKFALAGPVPAFLREDMTLSVEVETARRDKALVLPLTALRAQASDTQASVLVLQDGKAAARTLTIGLRTLDAVEVVQGLAEGDVVLVGGAPAEGGRVRTRALAWQPGQPGAAVGTHVDAGTALTGAMGR